MIALLIRASIDGALAAGLVWFVTRLVPSISASARTVLWWCAAARFLVALVPMAAIALPLLPAPAPSVFAASAHDAGPEWLAPLGVGYDSLLPSVVDRGDGGRGATPFIAETVMAEAIAAIWIVGVLALTAVGVGRWRRLRRAVRGSTEAPAEVLAEVRALAQGFGVARPPAVRISQEAHAPLVTGFLSPVILVPPAFASLTREQQRMSLCHELAHVTRGDLRAGCVPALAEALFFFHPLAALTAREYALAREAACDAVVIGALDVEPADYGRLLVDYSSGRARMGLAAAGVSTSAKQLKRRLLMLDRNKIPSRQSPLAFAIAVLLAAAVIVPIRLVARVAAQTGSTVMRTVPVTPTPDIRNMIEGGKRARGGVDDLRFEYILVHDDHNFTWGRLSAVMQWTQRTPPQPLARHGDPGVFEMELDRVQHVRKPGEPVFWFVKNGSEYVIRDAATLAALDAVWKPRKALVFYHDYDSSIGTGRVIRDLTPAERESAQRELTARLTALRRQVTDLTAQLSTASIDSRPLSPFEHVGMGLPILAQAIQQAGRPGEFDVERIVDRAFQQGLVSRVPTQVETLPVISGTVRTPQGASDPDTWVLLFAADHDRYVAEGMSAHQARTAADGTYSIRVLNPGNYYVIAVPAADKNGWLRTDKYSQVASLGTKLHSDKADVTIALTTKR
jgi:beta-lactamase regulating signal transducer with metallopeptidase domain